jgi:hypothetical protein
MPRLDSQGDIRPGSRLQSLTALLSVIRGLLAAFAILAAIRATPKPKPERGQHLPIRLRVGPVLRGQLGRLLVGITAFEPANAAATKTSQSRA